MKIVLIFLAVITAVFGAKVVEVDEKYQKSQKCKACHMHIVKDWEKSWHAKSHYEKDEYFRVTVDYVAKKTRKSLNSVKIKCATCHNPRISVTNTDIEYEINSLMNLNKDSSVDSAIANDAISEGINCIVCHNVDKIHTTRGEEYRGINRVEWTKSGTMSGPYDDAISPYHKTQYRDFVGENTDQLCFVCHANDRSSKGLVFTNMQHEYKKGQKGCIDCHMGPKKMGIAASLRIDNGKAKKREVRTHLFPGGHIPAMLKDALVLNLEQKNDTIIIKIKNPQPHNIPSGFGSRELIVDISYQEGGKEIDEKSISLTTHYTRRKGKPTIPHLAEKASKDMSIPAHGEKVLKVKNVAGATSVKVKLYYRLVNDEVRSILELKEDIWSRKSLITTEYLELK